MIERIRSAVATELANLGASEVEFAVEWPADLAHGDFAVNAAMAASKTLKKPPREIAQALVPVLVNALGADAAKIEIAGPGFVNITLSAGAVANELERANEAGETWGRNDTHAGSRVMVEYTDPNPFKEMHIGHLMSNTIGEAIARLISYSGAKLARANYEGDVGPHVAKALWGLREKGITEPATAKELGAAYTHGAQAYEKQDKAKSEIDALNREFYVALAKDPTDCTEEERALMELWRKGRDVSLATFEDLYRVLGTKFDYYFFESETTPIGLRVVREKLLEGVFEESEGAIVYRGEKVGKHTRVFITSHGTPTYETKDIGLAFLKEERWPSDHSIILTAREQTGHFSVVLEAMKEVAPLLGSKTTHIAHGLLKLTTGKMSSREGNVITAAEFLQELIQNAGERNPDPVIAEQVAVGALKYMILRSAPGGDIVFDREKSLSLEGDSGPYLQYATVRARSVIANAGAQKGVADTPTENHDIARLITRFPEVVRKAQSLDAPHVVAQYLTQLAGEWNSFYAKERIIGGEHEAYKVLLAQAFVQTMTNGLTLLGISVPERM